MTRTILAAALAASFGAGAHAMPNPASVHCIGQGGRLEIAKTDRGEVGFCNLPDGRRIEEWEFYRAWLADREKDGRRN